MAHSSSSSEQRTNMTEKTKEAPDVSGDDNDFERVEDPAPSPLPPPPSEESLAAWVQVMAAFVISFNTWGLSNTFGVFQTYYQMNLLRSETSSDIAWIGSTQAFFLFLVSLGAGPAFDRGYLRQLLWVGSTLFILGMFLVGIATQYYQVFLTQALLMGIGFGCIYVPAPVVVSQYFQKRAALAIGVTSAGTALGGILYPIVFTQLQPRIGFAWTTRVIAFILVGTSVIPLLFMKSRAPPKPSRNLLDPTVFRDIPYILYSTGLVLGFMGFFIIFNYIQLFAIDRTSTTKSVTDNILVIINSSSLIGRVAGGLYSDKIGCIHVLAQATVITSILTYSLIAIHTTAGLVVYAVLVGITSGAFTGLPATGIVALSPDKSKVGTRLGMTLAYIGVGVLVGNPIAGAILGQTGNWVGLLVFCASILAASFALIVASRIAKVGVGLKHKI
ncbi:MFS general substrate transporter [Xylariaceae sp. FL1019]|nr:MFS general substrate transporter [Xylariaceae sp. FL1019]